jgi:diacylglycerol O-acyltransferase
MVTRIVAPDAAKAAARKAAKAVQKNATRAASGMLGLSGERMTKVDTAWLRMDSESNLMMIVGVWTLKPGIKYEDLCQRVQERLLKYNRFRQRVVEDAAGATWVEDRKFDIANHVCAKSCPNTRRGRRSRRCRSAWASWPCSRWTRAARCGTSAWSRTTKAAAR